MRKLSGFLLAILYFCSVFPAGRALAQDCTGPSGAIGSVVYNADFDVFQGCTSAGWIAWHYLDLPAATNDACDPALNPLPGTVCQNGTVYAGTSGGNRLYTTRFDNGIFSWNNGTTNYSVTGATSLGDGLTNTNTILATNDDGAFYKAAQSCRSVGDDWYLPSRDELGVLYTNRAAIGGFNLSGVFYWSSSENNNGSARNQRFSDGGQSSYAKNNVLSVRCVRR